MLDRAGDLALKAPDPLLRVDEHSAHPPPPFRWLGNLFQNGPMSGHGDRAISPPTQRATVLPAAPTTSGRSREPEHSRRRSPQGSANGTVRTSSWKSGYSLHVCPWPAATRQPGRAADPLRQHWLPLPRQPAAAPRALPDLDPQGRQQDRHPHPGHHPGRRPAPADGELPPTTRTHHGTRDPRAPAGQRRPDPARPLTGLSARALSARGLFVVVAVVKPQIDTIAVAVLVAMVVQHLVAVIVVIVVVAVVTAVVLQRSDLAIGLQQGVVIEVEGVGYRLIGGHDRGVILTPA